MNNSSSATHKSHTQHSTTLNRKYVKRPTARVSTASTMRTSTAQPRKMSPDRSATAARTAAAAMKSDTMKRRQALAEQMNRERLKNMKPTVRPKVKAPSTAKPKPQPAEYKSTAASKTDRAAESAVRAVATMPDDTQPLKPTRLFTVKRVALAFACSALIVGALVYFVSNCAPELPVSVTALQGGIKSSYPTYIPRGYNRTSAVTEEGKVSYTFTHADGSSFTLTEEVSSWDSSTLERNDVKDTFSDYTVSLEGGLTLYISGSDCMWVSGGKKFYIDTTSGSLTNKQLKAIAASL